MAFKRGAKRELDTSDAPEEDSVIELGKNKRITVKKFKRVNLVDIREFYEADGELRPGKKGISLTEDQWNMLVDNFDSINEALTKLGDGDLKRQKPASQPKSDEFIADKDTADDVEDESVKKEVKSEEGIMPINE